jgi:lipopolysaccharide/colanic/teichoic acid biosynthesis glycosyltransferase
MTSREPRNLIEALTSQETLGGNVPPMNMITPILFPPGTRNSRLPRWIRKIGVSFKLLSWSLVVLSKDPIKRAFDIVGSIFFLLMFSPIFLITYVAIKLEDGGPAVFVQIRVGKWGRHFKFYKFRSMVPNAEELKTHLLQHNEMEAVTFKIKDDPRITKVGRIIRRLSIDELPQLFCVLKGDMSLVGPRPPVPSEVAEYKNHHLYRLDSVPGITCLWQVSGRNKIQFEDQVKLDVQYIHKRSILQDLKILFRTIGAVITARGAS